jgi:hypothetical protein
MRLKMTRLILPDEVEARLNQLGHMNDATAWDMGDLTVWIFEYCTIEGQLINPQTEEPMQSQELYSVIAKATNKNPFSIRDYAYTSKNIPPSVREKYSQFGRHHFKSLCGKFKTVRELENLCDIVLSGSDDGLVPVAVLRAKLAGQDGGPAKWEGRLKRVTSTCKRLAQDEQAPAFVRRAAELFIRRSVHPPLP